MSEEKILAYLGDGDREGGAQMKRRTKIQMTPAGLRPCGACVHEGFEPGRKHCHLCQVMGLYTPKPEEAAERARRKRQNRKEASK